MNVIYPYFFLFMIRKNILNNILNHKKKKMNKANQKKEAVKTVCLS